MTRCFIMGIELFYFNIKLVSFMSLRFCVFILLSGWSASELVLAHALSYQSMLDKNLKKYNIPTTPGLLEGKSPIIVDKTTAIQLGKALFWDSNVGSNGVACASCHFHAGADSRTTNQLNPGTLHLGDASSKTFNLLGNKGGVNYELKATDFPFFKFDDPDYRSTLSSMTDDVVGSAGVYKQIFTAIDVNRLDEDVCSPLNDPIHHIGNAETRQTTTRNTPTVINAIFNHRNFWDGRANNEFNGVSHFGPRDVAAKIWVAKNQNSKPVSQKLNLVNASLASQAVGPPTDMIEMSCGGRTFKDIAKKLLAQKPLASQEVHPTDSVLATLRDSSGLGLTSTYEALIKKAFNPIYWSGKGTVQDSGKNYAQIEANFSFFFGLAIQMYESTLVSNQSKLDLALAEMEAADNDEMIFPPSFTPQEQKGLENFSIGHCDFCHDSATFTAASNREIYTPDVYKKVGSAYVDRIGFVPSNSNTEVDATLIDNGFFNTSVTPDEFDIGLGGADPWGNPLSYSMQYVNSIGLNPKKFVDRFMVSPCAFVQPFTLDYKKSELKTIPTTSAGCATSKSDAFVPKAQIVKQESSGWDEGRMSTLTVGAFKIPTLRNVELTGPYMHNGSMKSLEEVVDFYNRGGNVQNRRHAATLVFELNFTQEDKDALVAFLKTLTDERVRWEKAPFDHPALKVPNGHTQSSSGGLMEDNYLFIPAVGKEGLTSEPLKPFQNYLK